MNAQGRHGLWALENAGRATEQWKVYLSARAQGEGEDKRGGQKRRDNAAESIRGQY